MEYPLVRTYIFPEFTKILEIKFCKILINGQFRHDKMFIGPIYIIYLFVVNKVRFL